MRIKYDIINMRQNNSIKDFLHSEINANQILVELDGEAEEIL